MDAARTCFEMDAPEILVLRLDGRDILGLDRVIHHLSLSFFSFQFSQCSSCAPSFPFVGLLERAIRQGKRREGEENQERRGERQRERKRRWVGRICFSLPFENEFG